MWNSCFTTCVLSSVSCYTTCVLLSVSCYTTRVLSTASCYTTRVLSSVSCYTTRVLSSASCYTTRVLSMASCYYQPNHHPINQPNNWNYTLQYWNMGFDLSWLPTLIHCFNPWWLVPVQQDTHSRWDGIPHSPTTKQLHLSTVKLRLSLS